MNVSHRCVNRVSRKIVPPPVIFCYRPKSVTIMSQVPVTRAARSASSKGRKAVGAVRPILPHSARAAASRSAPSIGRSAPLPAPDAIGQVARSAAGAADLIIPSRSAVELEALATRRGDRRRPRPSRSIPSPHPSPCVQLRKGPDCRRYRARGTANVPNVPKRRKRWEHSNSLIFQPKSQMFPMFPMFPLYASRDTRARMYRDMFFFGNIGNI